MTTHCFAVLTQPRAGQEAEYHAWYDGVHIPHVLGFQGFERAQRFRLIDSGPGSEPPRFLTLYQVVTDDWDALRGRLRDARASGDLVMSDSLDVEHFESWAFEAIGEPTSNEKP